MFRIHGIANCYSQEEIEWRIDYLSLALADLRLLTDISGSAWYSNVHNKISINVVE